YRDNVEAVLNTVPAERLLVHKLGDGWAPLCAHLAVPVPDEPYPARNTTQAFRTALSLN
ncbi:sulfotransferase family protein, partial [Mesorhizobium sp. M00.F.Ca.ET.186.01.1.1]